LADGQVVAWLVSHLRLSLSPPPSIGLPSLRNSATVLLLPCNSYPAALTLPLLASVLPAALGCLVVSCPIVYIICFAMAKVNNCSAF
jgi:hypothetical protein